MDPRTESLNGKKGIPMQTKTVIDEAKETADHFVDEVKAKTREIQKQAGTYIATTDDYAKQHPWRIALTAAGIGAIAGALLARKKN